MAALDRRGHYKENHPETKTATDIDTSYREGCRLFYLRESNPEGSRDRAALIFRRIIAREPRHHQSLNMLGLYHDGRREHEQAREMFRQAIAVMPRGIYHLNLGISFAREGLLPEALETLAKAATLEPEDPSAHFNLGLVHFLQERTEDAIACWRRTRELAPDYDDIHLHLAVALVRAGSFPEAQAVLQDGIERFPNQVDLYHHLSILYEEARRYETAARLWRRFLERNSHKDKAVLAQARARMEELLQKAAGKDA